MAFPGAAAHAAREPDGFTGLQPRWRAPGRGNDTGPLAPLESFTDSTTAGRSGLGLGIATFPHGPGEHSSRTARGVDRKFLAIPPGIVRRALAWRRPGQSSKFLLDLAPASGHCVRPFGLSLRQV